MLRFYPQIGIWTKNFDLTGELGQVHMTKTILIFLHAGKWLFLLGVTQQLRGPNFTQF